MKKKYFSSHPPEFQKGTRIIYYFQKGRIIQTNRKTAIVQLDDETKSFVCDYSLLTVDESPQTAQNSPNQPCKDKRGVPLE